MARAGELGLKLVIPLVNNWRDFGGMDQYVRWRETQLGSDARSFYHSDFYTDPVIRQWYKDWIEHLLNRVNTITGVQYKDDPAIMTWELANEPRCKGSGVYPPSPECTTQTLIDWADEISAFIKSIDRNHLVSVGDEGFYCEQDGDHWTTNCGEGADTVAFTRLPHIDVMSFHLYPDAWGTDHEWSKDWIRRHLKDAWKLRKPAMLGEYGWEDKSTRNVVFKEWTDIVRRYHGAGALYWILSGLQDDGTFYPDYDGHTVYCPSPVCTTISNFGEMMESPFWRWRFFEPVADHDVVVTEFETPVTLDPAANDIAYGRHNETLVETIDLDTAAEGRQTGVSLPGGTFTLQGDGTVEFVPAAGFDGKVSVAYTIEDLFGQVSNAANLQVTVKPLPGAPIRLFSFESGTEGWAPASWNASAGSLARSDAFATDGTYSLAVDSVDGGWFEVQFPEPLDLSDGYTLITLDLAIDDPVNGGTWHNVAMQVGDGWDWCQGPGQWVPNSRLTVELDLLNMTCNSGNAPDLSRINTMLVHFNGDGAMDSIWAR